MIPVPESYVRFIHLGDPVSVNVPSLSRTFPGKVARFSVDVREDTRTMHTEVDVPNPQPRSASGPVRGSDYHARKERRRHRASRCRQWIRTTTRRTVDVVDSSGKIERRQIVLGIQTATDAEVISGLQEGEIVVVSDRSGLKAGQDSANQR